MGCRGFQVKKKSLWRKYPVLQPFEKCLNLYTTTLNNSWQESGRPQHLDHASFSAWAVAQGSPLRPSPLLHRRTAQRRHRSSPANPNQVRSSRPCYFNHSLRLWLPKGIKKKSYRSRYCFPGKPCWLLCGLTGFRPPPACMPPPIPPSAASHLPAATARFGKDYPVFIWQLWVSHRASDQPFRCSLGAPFPALPRPIQHHPTKLSTGPC